MKKAQETLASHLEAYQRGGGRADVAKAVAVLAEAGAALSHAIAIGPFGGEMAEVVGDGGGGDQQKRLDIEADRLFRDAMRRAPVAVFGSEESDLPEILDVAGSLAVAIDPLDGSSNIDTNVSIGTIFAIFPVPDSGTGGIESALMQSGRDQVAAGFFIYGPQTALVLTLRAGTHVFTLDTRDGTFRLTRANVCVPEASSEYAINASNYRHWPRAIRDYIDDLISGSTGPRGKDFNMRWIASMVAEAYRIIARGGIFLYPRDGRKGYENGRLRLVYEANPIALVFEQAGGAATDGVNRILDITPTGLHQRTPLVFGSAEKVRRVARYHHEAPAREQSSPLFNERGLFRP
ncbi:MAG: class 1 fructose-bisphosphatase [Hyphomicrobiaceae bacterium]